MTTLTKNWTQRTKDRFEASPAVDYVLAVASGEVDSPDRARLDTCWKMIDKLVPTLKATEHSADPERPPVFNFNVPIRD